jgi:flagellar biosynthesis protein FliQ
MVVNFSLGAGEAYRDAEAGQWTSGFFRQSGGDSVSLIRHAGATWQITGVQLEAGKGATEFERRPKDREDDLIGKPRRLAGQADPAAGALARRAAFITNRVLWIPYITAYDWFRFHDDVLKGEFLQGRTAGLLAWLQGQDRYPMEKKIFGYQFGEASSSTGTSNAVYFADAYVNFGWPGILVTSLVVGLIFSMLAACVSIPASAVSVMSAFGLMVASLTANLLSGGLVILLLLAFATRGVGQR